MIKKLSLMLSVGISLFCCSAYAQSMADINSPKIVPPSPDAAALGKYGQIPVDKSTGVPSISIPMYEIKTPRFSLPISLSYHASGIKVDETASWAGIGWSLNAGGVITRSINGIPDETPGIGYLNCAAPPTIASIAANFHADSSYLENVCKLNQDSQPDNFFYNFVSQSGEFVFGEDKKPIIIPYKPLKITYQRDSTAITSSFTILDEQGNSYWFHDRELSTSDVSTSLNGASSWYLTQMISADKTDTVKFVYKPDTTTFDDVAYSFSQNLGPLSPGGNGLWSMVNTWNWSHVQQIHLSSILFKGGKVDFKSLGGRQDFGLVSLDSVIVSNYDYNQKKYNRLKSFKLLTGYSYSGVTNPSGFNTSDKAKYRLILTGLSENDQNNAAVKTHQFTYNSTALPPVHNFGQDKWGYYNGNYTNQSLLEAQNVISIVFPSSSYAVYNIGSGQGGNRSVSAANMQAGVLQQITYPTKGYTTFSYEPNQYSAPAITDTVIIAGAVGYYHETSTASFTALVTGLVAFHVHVASIGTGTGYTSNANIMQGSTLLFNQDASTTADYDQNIILTVTAGTTYQLNASAHGGTSTSTFYPQANVTVRYQITGANVATNVGGLRVKAIKNYDSNGSIISTETYKYGSLSAGYESGIGDFLTSSSLMTTRSTHVTQYTYGGVAGPSTQVEDNYSNASHYPLSSLSGSPVAYEVVTVYHGDTVQNIGKSIYTYTVTQDSIMRYTSPATIVPLYVRTVDGGGHVHYAAWSAGTQSEPPSYNPHQGIKPVPLMWKNGEPVSEAHYRNNGGTYVLQQSKSTGYNLAVRTPGRGQSIQYSLEFYGAGRSSYPQYTNINDFIIYDYPISAGSRVPADTYTINYANDGVTPLTTETVAYYYDNYAHMYPTRIETYTSAGDSILKQVKYPQDMVQTGIYGTMTAAHIISPVIQFTQSKNYTQNSSGTLISSGTQLMQSITNYGNSNPNSIINPSSVSLQVMANAAETRLNYLNYDSNGNVATVAKLYGSLVSYIWGYKGAYPVAEVKNAKSNDIFYESFEDGNGNTGNGDAKTGHYGYVGTYSKALTGLDNGSYRLTYWQKTGAVWAPVTDTVTVSGGAYTISLTGQVDDIRFYPARALMTTYTYDPLIGVNSTTDAKGEISYYEYDSLQRLVNIRDQNKNIVKSFCYNYAGQISNCFINQPSYTNAPQTGTYTKNCGTGYIGSAYTYTVPGGTYTSTSQGKADSLAMADLAVNGQDFANLYGTCIQSNGFTVNNTTGTAIAVTFYGSSTYYYTIAAHTNITVQVPTATYTSMTAGVYGGPTYTFTLGTRAPVTYSIAGFSTVVISTGSSDLTLSIH